MNPIDFGECWMFIYGRSTKKNSYTLRPRESNSLMCSSIQTLHLFELIFGVYIIGHRPTYYVEFGEFRINSFFTGVQKRILIQYSLWSQIIRRTLVYMQCFSLAQIIYEHSKSLFLVLY